MLFPTKHSRKPWANSSRNAFAMLCALVFLDNMVIGQNRDDSSSRHASLAIRNDHKIQLSVEGSWPNAQILNRLRREYGWTLDYEEAPQPASVLTRSLSGRVSPSPRSVTVVVPQPVSGDQGEEHTVVAELAKGLSEGGEAVYTVVDNGSSARFDVVSNPKGENPILSTVISLNPQRRSVSETIAAILDAISKSFNCAIIQGGLADPAADSTQVVIGGTAPARVLLAKALDALAYRRVWILTYDPQDQRYVIGIEPAVQAMSSLSGQILVKPIKTPENVRTSTVQ